MATITQKGVSGVQKNSPMLSRAGKICGLILIILLCRSADCAGTDNNPAQIQKLLTPPKIDAAAGDWSVPPAIKKASPEGKMEMRLGYDAENFYIFAEVGDNSPLKNNADRPEEMIKGGDAIVFYFKTRDGDEQRVAMSVCQGKPLAYVSRTQSKTKKPYTYSSPVGKETFDYVAPLEGVKMSFGNTSDTYTLEASIPWKSLGMSPPPPRFSFDAQVIFSDPAGTTNAGFLWWHASEGPGLTVEDLPTEAKLYPDTWGEAVLLPDGQSTATSTAKKTIQAASGTGLAGQFEIELPRDCRLSVNITDEKGWILRELVMAEKFQKGKHTVRWDGRDRYGEPLPPGEYQWKALLFDGMKADFMGSVGSSGRPPYRTPDGLGAVGGQHGAQKSVAADSGGVYMANACEEGQPAVRKINPQTGIALWKRSAGGFKTARHIAAGDGMACFINTESSKTTPHADLVRINPSTGMDLPMGSGKGAKPRVALEIPPDGEAIQGLAIVGGKAYFSVPSENRIGAVDMNTGSVEKNIGCKAPSPQGLARLNDSTLLICSGKQVVAWNITGRKERVLIDGLEEPKAVCADEKGRIYVSELGNSQQVKKFSPDGKLTATIGTAGGRGNNAIPYNPLAFANITSMAIGPDGNLWLAEIKSPPKRFIKITPEGKWLEDNYGPVAYNAFGPDLDDLSRVFYNCLGNALFVETKIDYALYRKNPLAPAAAWKIVSIQDLGLGADGVTRNPVMSDLADNGYGHVVAFMADNGKKYLFRMSKNNRASNPVAAGLWIWKDDRWIPSAFISRNPTKNSKTPQDDFSWADQNGDGLVQEDEKYKEPATEEIAWIDRNLTLHGLTGKWKPAEISACGAPGYRKTSFTPYVRQGESNYWGDGYNFVSNEKDGSVYYICNMGPHRHMSFWDRATENRLVKIKDGKVRWIAGRHSTKPGLTEFTTASGIAGIADGIVLAHNIEPATYIAYTEDGFVLGDVLLDENGVHQKVGGNVINIENFTGLFIKDPETGKRILFAVSSGDDRILEISGPGKTSQLSGNVRILTASPSGEKQPIAIPYSNWYGNVLRGLGIDGEDTEWNPDIPAVSLAEKGEVIGDVRMRRDAGMLNIFAVISDQTPLEEGDGVEITLSKTADLSKAVTLLLSSSADPKGNRVGTATLSKNGAPVESKKVKVGITERWLKLGYRIEAAVPLELIPEFTGQREQNVRTEIKSEKTGKAELQASKKNVADLVSPLYGNIRIIRKTAGKAVETKYSPQLSPVTFP